MKHSFGFSAAVAMAALCPVAARADVKLPALFADHMVLQRDMKVPVWGIADAGEAVTVSIAGQNKTAVADASGKWMVKLDALKVSEPLTMTVKGKNTLMVQDVLVGEVWLASGQSNMQFALAWNKDYFAADIAADDSKLRCFTVANRTSPQPLGELTPNVGRQQMWEVATPQTVPGFTAVGYFFARELRKQLGVPVGIIHSAWGGTDGESWASHEALSADPELKTMADAQIRAMENLAADKAQFPVSMAAWEEKYGAKDPGNSGAAQGWAKPDFNDADWKTAKVPLNFGQLGMTSGGSVWFRKTLDFPAEAANKAFTWNLGWSADNVTGYFNGVQLPVSPSTPTPPFFIGPHSFTVPTELVHAGANTLTLRVFSHNTNGTVSPGTAQMSFPITTYGPDADQWRYMIEHENAPLSPEAAASLPKSPGAQPQNTASYIYNAQIAPLMPFPIRGAIWYQGENNSQRAMQYRKILPALIGDWRNRWNEGNFPFYIVQLANYGSSPPEPRQSGWAELREAQAMTAASVPNTGLAVTVDIGEGNNIHPKNKQDVGKRLALLALNRTYGQKTEDSGPIYQSMKIEGNAIRLKFAHAAGLTAKGGPLKYFAIAGDDRKFVWADAKIEGDTVVVSSAQVPNPKAVRYAWADNPEGANLYNAAGLPASPFRTDLNDSSPVPAPVGTLSKTGLLLNGDFSSPKVPDDKNVLAARADAWVYDVRAGQPAIGIEAWKKERPPFFFWSDPDGSISQTASAKIGKAGEVYTLTYFYGGQGKGGSYTLTTQILVDGKVAATDTRDVDLAKPGIERTAALLYTAKAVDAGKSIGVAFTMTKIGAVAIQGALRNVVLTKGQS